MRYNKIKKNLAITVILAFVCTISSEGFMYMFNNNGFISGVSAAKVARLIFIGIMLFALVGRLIVESACEDKNVVIDAFGDIMLTKQSA